MKIDTNDLPADLAAECLREFCFDENGEFVAGFRDCLDITNEVKDFFVLDCGYKITNKYNPILDLQIISQHDGDETLIIIDKNYIYINWDAKKTYNWTRISKTA